MILCSSTVSREPARCCPREQICARLGRAIFMRGSKSSYGVVGLIGFFLCGFLILESAGFAGVATAQVSITSPAAGSTVKGDVPISLSMGSNTSWVNLYIDGNYLASTPPSQLYWLSTTSANGSHTISATAFNSSRAVVGSASKVVMVENGSTPTPTIASTPAPTQPPSSSSDPNRRDSYLVAGERFDGFRHGVDCRANQCAGQLG